MRFGILPPYRTGVTADPEWMTRFALAAESAGFESLYVVEHVVVPADYGARYPYSETGRMPLPEDCPIPDPLELLAFLAARTDRIRLGTGVLVLPEHNPVILAKRIATLDVLSGGRVQLGVGVGWLREELEAAGVDFASRGRRTDEAIDALRLLWTEEEASFEGAFFAFERAFSRPRPLQPGGPPIHVGGHSVAAARRAGARGDGYFPLGLDGQLLTERVATMRDAAEAAGRDPERLELSLGGLLSQTGAAEIERAARAGAQRMILSTTEADADALSDTIAAFGDAHIAPT